MIKEPDTDSDVTARWHGGLFDPPSISDVERRFLEALAVEYGNGWPFYDQKTRDRMGDDQVRLNIEPIKQALARAGLQLVNIDK